MACLNCLNCMGYEDGKLSVVLDNDGHIECNDAGELSLQSDPKTVSDDVPFESSLIDSCDNGIFSDTQGRIWMDPASCMECFQDSAEGFIGPDSPVLSSGSFFTPQHQLTLPPSDVCYPTKYMVSVKRFIIVDQSTATDFRILDRVNGVENPCATADRISRSPRHFSKLSKGFWWSITRGNNLGPLNIPFQIRTTTFGVGGNGVIYRYGWQWHGLKVAMKECD